MGIGLLGGDISHPCGLPSRPVLQQSPGSSGVQDAGEGLCDISFKNRAGVMLSFKTPPGKEQPSPQRLAIPLLWGRQTLAQPHRKVQLGSSLGIEAMFPRHFWGAGHTSAAGVPYGPKTLKVTPGKSGEATILLNNRVLLHAPAQRCKPAKQETIQSLLWKRSDSRNFRRNARSLQVVSVRQPHAAPLSQDRCFQVWPAKTIRPPG